MAAPRLFALLVAIDGYVPPVRPLRGCRNDIAKFELFLRRAYPEFDHQILLLQDGQATKAAVVQHLRQHLGQAQGNDVALFYFSGHGAQEWADPQLWRFEPDGKLEGLVCFDSIQEGGKFQLLADKELRFLLHEVSYGPPHQPKPTPPHLVSIFDCCHSGDNTRNAFIAEEDPAATTRERRFIPTVESRLSNIVPQRAWTDFLFAEAIQPTELRTRPLAEVLPEGHYIQMSGCDAQESSYETQGSGVFSRNLIEVLERSNGNITYADLRHRLKFFIKNQFQQTPQIYSPRQEADDLLQRSFLNRPTRTQPLLGNVVLNPKLGWILDLGAIHGISNQAEFLEVFDQDHPTVTYRATITKVKSGETLLSLDATAEQALENKIVKGYVADFASAPIKVFIHNYGADAEPAKALAAELKRNSKNLSLAKTAKEADYAVQIFQQRLVVTRPGDPFRPLVMPSEDLSSDSIAATAHYLRHIAQWEYVKNLSNDGNNRLPLETVSVEFFHHHNGRELPLPLGNDQVELPFDAGDFGDRAYGINLKIRLRNTSAAPIYVALLYISPAFGVYGELLANPVQRLEPASADSAQGGSVWVFDGDFLTLTHDKALEVFNHPAATNHFKLIASREEFSINTLLQSPLPDPIDLLETDKGEATRGMMRRPANEEAGAWITRTITITSPNPTYNQIPAQLEDWLKTPAGPFLQGLFLQTTEPFGTQLQTLAPPTFNPESSEAAAEAKAARGFVRYNLLIPGANFVARERRQRRYRSIIKQYPDRIRIVSEGDSWFQYPDPRVDDVIEHLLNHFAVYSLDEASDTLRNYFQEGHYLQAVLTHQPAFLLLSGGGNDILGKQFLDFLQDQFPRQEPGQNPQRFLRPAFFAELESLGKIYSAIFQQLQREAPKVRVIVHGYDYFFPGDEPRHGFLGRYMIQKGIYESRDRKALADFIINQFNAMLDQVAAQHPNARYLDLRGTVPQRERWWDEIHPNSQGFQDVAIRFQKLILSLS